MSLARTATPHHVNSSSTPSNRTNMLASVLATIVGYPPPHIITSSIVRYQASNIPLLQMTRSKLYEIVFNTGYKSVSLVPSHAFSLLNGYSVGLLDKGLKNVVRYPAQSYFAGLMKGNPQVEMFFQNIAGERSNELIKATAGSAAGLTEGLLHPIDTLRNILMTLTKKFTFKEIGQLALEKNIALANGMQYTLLRNSIGGFAQFGAYAVTMKHGFQVEEKEATKAQITAASFVAAAFMIFATMPFDNKKLRAQLGLEFGKSGGMLSLFKGTVPKILTKSIGPTIMLSLTQIFSRAIDSMRTSEQPQTPAASRGTLFHHEKTTTKDISPIPREHITTSRKY